MMYVLYAIAGIVIVLIALVWWRITSVARGMRQRDMKIAEVPRPLSTLMPA